MEYDVLDLNIAHIALQKRRQIMIIRCCKCKKLLGEKEPLNNKSFTDTYCDDCRREFEKEIKEHIEKHRKDKK